jgi:hypothetical protein
MDNVACFFENLESELVNVIQSADGLVGCVAWLTNSSILQALSEKPVSLVVQNESWLTARNKCTRHRVRQLYGALQNDFKIDPIRLNGTKKRGIKPLMHHKFLVILTQCPETLQYKPNAVWTGSFNLTKNSTLSMENAVIKNPAIAKMYYTEWEKVYHKSNTFV